MCNLLIKQLIVCQSWKSKPASWSFYGNNKMMCYFENVINCRKWNDIYVSNFDKYNNISRAQNCRLDSTYQSISFRHGSQWKNVTLNVWLKIIMTTYLKRWTMHINWGESCFCSMDKKMISPHIEWYFVNVLVCAHFLQNWYKGVVFVNNIKWQWIKFVFFSKPMMYCCAFA